MRRSLSLSITQLESMALLPRPRFELLLAGVRV